MRYFLGIEISRTYDVVYMSRQKYIKDLLSKHGLKSIKHSKTPMKLKKIELYWMMLVLTRVSSKLSNNVCLPCLIWLSLLTNYVISFMSPLINIGLQLRESQSTLKKLCLMVSLYTKVRIDSNWVGCVDD